MHRLRGDSGFVQALVLLVALSALAGVLVAGFALPVIGGAGLIARNATDSFAELPSALKVRPLAQQSRILDRNGETIATFYDENRVLVPLRRIAPVMRKAIVAIEDSRFYEHGALDLRGTARALLTNSQSGSVQQGGSTLTQQYVKNVLLEAATTKAEREAATAPNVTRKLRELKLAIGVEEKYSKAEILENYLNIALFGNRAYGIQTAARTYFSKPASKLSLVEAATLAAIVKSPTKYDPINHPYYNLIRRNVVLSRMQQLGQASRKTVARAKKIPVRATLHPTQVSNGCLTSTYPLYCDFVVNVILNDPAFGKSSEERQALLKRGGLTITTTLAPKMERAAQKAIRAHVHAKDKVASAMAMIEPGTGEVRAIASSRPYGTGKHETNIDYAVDYTQGGSRGFQAGSTFKAFTLAAALKSGISPYRTQFAPYHLIGPQPTRDCSDHFVGTNPKGYFNESPAENGTYTMFRAIEDSINTYFVPLQNAVGLCKVVSMAEDVGVHRADGDPLQQVESFTLGVNEVSPLTMADAYATFAARGVHCNPVAISKVVDRTGQELDIPQGDCKQVIEPELADEVNKMLQGVITQGTGTRAAIGRPAAGKTGTTNQRISVWFIGYTPDLAAAVWAGNPDNSKYELKDRTIGGTFYPGGICGGCLPGPIWAQAMSKALKGRPKSKFTEPNSFPQAPQPVFTPPPNPQPTFSVQAPQPTTTHKTKTKTQTTNTGPPPTTQQPPPPSPIKPTKPKKSPGPGPGGPKCKPQGTC